MDLNDFIFRDDTALALGADLDGDFATAQATGGRFALMKVSLAALVGSAMLSLSHFLGIAKGL